MLRKIGAAIYRGLFWTYERGTWQYDVMVALILAFIFFTPRGWFNDRPNFPEASGVVLLSSNKNEKVYQVRIALLEPGKGTGAEEAIREQVAMVLQSYTGKNVRITEIRPEKDASGQVVSYAVSIQD